MSRLMHALAFVGRASLALVLFVGAYFAVELVRGIPAVEARISEVQREILSAFGGDVRAASATTGQYLQKQASGHWEGATVAAGASSLADTLAEGNTSDGTNLQIASGDRLILDGPGTNRSIVNANIGGTAALWVANEAGTAASGLWGNIFEARSDNGVESYSALNTNGLTLYEQTAPGGTANQAKVFAQDNGSGKTQVMVIFGSGAAIELAIEP